MALKDLLVSLSFPPITYCDNPGAISLFSNPVFNIHTKRVEADVHLRREKVQNPTFFHSTLL